VFAGLHGRPERCHGKILVDLRRSLLFVKNPVKRKSISTRIMRRP
jgi:hypothetical protein